MSKILKEFTNRKTTILTTATHERYQSCFANLPYNFILWNHAKAKPWHSHFAEIPDNHLYVNRLTPNLKFDAVLCQNKFTEYDILKAVSLNNRVPLIQLEHTTCGQDASYDYVNHMFKKQGDVNVFITDYSARAWGFRKYETVNHMIDVDKFKPAFSKEKSSHVLSVVNDYKERNRECGFDVWQKNTKDILTKLVGTSNCGLSESAENLEDLIEIYQDHLIFLNTSLISPLPMSLLEAMSCGLCVISTNTCDIPNVINDGINGFLYDPNDDVNQLIKKVQNMDMEDIVKIGSNARKTIQELFSKEMFVNKWQSIIENVL